MDWCICGPTHRTLKTMSCSRFCASIRIGWEIRCLLYTGFFYHATNPNLYWSYCLHWSRDFVCPVCWIFLYYLMFELSIGIWYTTSKYFLFWKAFEEPSLKYVFFSLNPFRVLFRALLVRVPSSPRLWYEVLTTAIITLISFVNPFFSPSSQKQNKNPQLFL